MRRVISVWFPAFPTDRLRRPESDQENTQPRIVVAGRAVVAVDAVAAGLGLRPGMKLAQARALVPGLSVHDADPAGDAAALNRLAEWCLRYAPLAAADPPDGLWIDVTGSTHLYGGEVRLLRDLVSRLNDLGWAAHAASANAAHTRSRIGSPPPDLRASVAASTPPVFPAAPHRATLRQRR